MGATCSLEEIKLYTSLFKEFYDIFAWSYEEISGIYPQIIVHKIKTYPRAHPIRQRIRLANLVAIKEEVEIF